MYLQKLAEDISKQTGADASKLSPEGGGGGAKRTPPPPHPPPHTNLNLSSPYSEFESRFGRYSDPLYSRHQLDKRASGLDPSDEEYVFVDPHIMATPTLADTNGDGVINELVIPVSYYFDPYYYGDKVRLAQLGGLEEEELQNFIASGIVVVDLNSARVVSQKFIGISQVSSPQPSYMLATPTIVRNTIGEEGKTVIIVGSASGELHVLDAKTLAHEPGFPITLDSMTGQVAVADLLGNGDLEMVIGDNSGNVYCIDRRGRRVWEREVGDAVVGSARFADLEGDGTMEVVFSTQMGNLWVLNAKTGEPFPNYPLHLNVPVQASVLLMHLTSSARQKALSILLPFSGGLYIVDALTGCLDKVESDHMFMEVLSEDIDPFHPGLEVLSASIDGFLVCFSTGGRPAGDLEQALESWPGEAIGQNGFTHRLNSFAVVLPHTNDTVRDISGRSFNLDFQLVDNSRRSPPHHYSILVTVGRKHVLYNSTLTVHLKQNVYSLSIPTPPTPTHAFLTLQLCNAYLQCESVSYNVKFNLHFEDSLQWYLALPFLLMCGSLLWLLRESGAATLPTTTTSAAAAAGGGGLTSSRKDM